MTARDMKREIDLMIFDLDGTLTDSLTDISRSANYALTRVGLKELPEEQIRDYIGDGIPQLLRKCIESQSECSGDLLDRAEAYYRPHYDEHCLDHITLYPNVRKTLDFFSAKTKAVISNKMEGFTIKILNGLGLMKHFKAVIGGDTFPERKPHPRPVIHLLGLFSAKPGRTVIIGDGHQDILCGKSAGIVTCAVTYGFRQSPELQSADYRIRDLIQLNELFR